MKKYFQFLFLLFISFDSISQTFLNDKKTNFYLNLEVGSTGYYDNQYLNLENRTYYNLFQIGMEKTINQNWKYFFTLSQLNTNIKTDYIRYHSNSLGLGVGLEFIPQKYSLNFGTVFNPLFSIDLNYLNTYTQNKDSFNIDTRFNSNAKPSNLNFGIKFGLNSENALINSFGLILRNSMISNNNDYLFDNKIMYLGVFTNFKIK